MQTPRDYPMTTESIARAKAAQQAERDEVYRQTGHRIVESSAVVIIECRHAGCRYSCSARTEGRAIRSIAAHIKRSHFPREES